MINRRTLIFGGVLALVCGILIYQWILGWGLITLNFNNAPLAKVIKSVERQGWVNIESSMPATTMVSIHVQKVSLVDALNELAARADGRIRLTFLAAPTDAQIKEALANFTNSTNPGTWTGFGGGMGFGMDMDDGPAVDGRAIEWKVSDSKDHSLQGIFSQGAQKTGVTFAAPTAWNPVIGSLPSEGPAAKVTRSLVSKAGGKMLAVFLLSPHPQENADGDGPGHERTIFSGHHFQGAMNPDWANERSQAQIKLLPPEEREDAQKMADTWHNFMSSMKGLSDADRRAKWEAFMNDPNVQEMMMDRMANQMGKSAPAKREAKMRQYVAQKIAAQGGGGAPR